MTQTITVSGRPLTNLTPHAIAVIVDSVTVTIPPSGTVARLVEHDEPVVPAQSEREARVVELLGAPGALLISDDEHEIAIAAPVVRRQYGAIEGLPAEDEPVLVSALVLDAVRRLQPWRRHVYAPDVGAGAVRDAAGRIVGTRRLLGV